MQRLGKVKDWNDERGYGFIAPLDASDDDGSAFFHIRDYQQQGRRQEPGELVKYLARQQDDGRRRAAQVMRAVQPPAKARHKSRMPVQPDNPYSTSHDMMRAAALLAYAVVLARATSRCLLPAGFAYTAGLISIVTCLAYAADKRFAQTDGRRIPEARPHLLELMGGRPGALLAQRIFRHKSRKAGYRAVFRLMAALNIAATVAWICWQP